MLERGVHQVLGDGQDLFLDSLCLAMALKDERVVVMSAYLPPLVHRLSKMAQNHGHSSKILANIQLEHACSLSQILWTLESLGIDQPKSSLLVLDVTPFAHALLDVFEMALVRSISLQLKRLAMLHNLIVIVRGCDDPSLWHSSFHKSLYVGTMDNGVVPITLKKLLMGTTHKFSYTIEI